jgi:multimeric flavodoxin WrbA
MRGDYIYAMATSPRPEGNSETLLDRAVEGARSLGVEVVKDALGVNPVNPCMGCNRCGETGECVQHDRMQEVYPHLSGAAAVILAAPIFSMHICSQAKMLIDRCQRFWSVKYLLKRHLVQDETRRAGRTGLFISVCGRDAPETFTCVRPTLAYFFSVLEISRWERLELSGIDEQGAVLRVPEALERAYRLGATMAEQVLSL